MDEFGFFPYGLKCSICGAILGGTRYAPGDFDHPAELYAGSFTSLCDKCMMMSGFIVRTEWDGARIISYPPDCPSHRRDRMEYIAYADCLDCKGEGRHYISRAMGQGGPYYWYCTTCSARYYGEAHRQRWSLLRQGVKRDGYNRKFVQAVCALWRVKKPEQVPFFPWSMAQTVEYERLRNYWLGEYDRAVLETEATIDQERKALLEQAQQATAAAEHKAQEASYEAV